MERKFDPAKLDHLNDPERIKILNPELMWELLGVPNAGTVVEVGAGTGLVAAEFLALSPQLSIVAVDVEPMMFEWMMEHRPEVAEGRMVPLLAEEVHVPLPEDSTDAVYSVSLHHELHEPVASYREALRILKPGAPMLVADWYARETPKGPPIELRSSPKEIAAVMREAGFADIELHQGLPYHSITRAVKPKE